MLYSMDFSASSEGAPSKAYCGSSVGCMVLPVVLPLFYLEPVGILSRDRL